MKNSLQPKLFFCCLLLISLFTLTPIGAFAADYGNALSSAEAESGMGKELIQVIWILGAMVGLGAAVVFFIKVISKK